MPVSLITLMGNAAALPIEEKRKWGEDYIEVVLAAAQQEGWMKRLEEVFGPPVKPVGKSPTGDQERLAAPWGGIRKNQILLLQKVEGENVVALLWPWGDGGHVTVKIGRASAG